MLYMLTMASNDKKVTNRMQFFQTELEQTGRDKKLGY